METLHTIAVHKAVKEDAFKAASKVTEVGQYDVDVTVRIVGTITKGADELQVKTDQSALLLALRQEVGEDRFRAIAATIPPLNIKASGKVTSKLTVEVI